jgi:hypothetical protein
MEGLPCGLILDAPRSTISARNEDIGRSEIDNIFHPRNFESPSDSCRQR